MGNSVTAISERWRKKIVDSNLVHRLITHLEGKLDPPLSAADQASIIKLMGKVMPDLKTVEMRGTVNHTVLSRGELEARLVAMGRDPAQVWASFEDVVDNQRVIDVEQAEPGTLTDTKSVESDQQVLEFIDDADPGAARID